MSSQSEDRSDDTVRLLRRPPRIFTDPCGHNVWVGEVVELDLEPVLAENTDPYNSASRADPWSRI